MSTVEDTSPLKSLLLEDQERLRVLIESGECSDAYPSSSAQKRLWLIDRLNDNQPAYIIFGAYRVVGALDISHLRACFRTIQARHDTLRTGFFGLGGEPVQRIEPNCDIPLPVLDFTGVSGDLCWRRACEQIATGRFDLTKAPLWRVALLRFSEHDHIIAIGLHHIICDGWSVAVLVSEVIEIYTASAERRAARLAPLPIQYSDYTLWQRKYLSGQTREQLLHYWKDQLADAPQLTLPRANSQPHAHADATHQFRFGPSMTRRIEEASRLHGITPYVFLLTVFQVLLSRCCRQPDVVVGTPAANRGRTELEPMIGFFVNMLCMRVQVRSSESFRSLLARNRHIVFEAYAHQDLPFDQLVEALRPTRVGGRNPLFEVIFAFQNAPNRTFGLPGLKIEQIPLSVSAARFDLEFHGWQIEEDLVFLVEYRQDRLDAQSVERFVRWFIRLTSAVVSDPDRQIGSIELLDESEKQTLTGWSAGGPAASKGRPLLPLWFAQVAQENPQATAIVCDGNHVSYSHLNALANRIAYLLRTQELKPESIIGLCFSPTPWMAAAIVGVLKAGCAYLPIVPGSTVERREYIIGDACPALILVGRAEDARTLSECGVPICVLSDEVLQPFPADELGSAAGPDNAAYVLYTSGSTGRPKGVLVTHQNLLRLFAVTEQLVQPSRTDRWTFFHSYAFDFSAWEFWGALLYGGALVMAPEDVRFSPERLYRLVCNEGITVLNMVPSPFLEFARAGESSGAAGLELSLRLIIFGGERLDFPSLRRWIGRHGDERPVLINMYGITETTVHVTHHRITADQVKTSESSLIGRPLGDLRMYICEPTGPLAPVGVAGEIYVGGDGISRGYLNNPALTAERFVPDPFSGIAGARLYRSGDVARWLPNGVAEYAGRTDDQIKIRGFRIEPGEIQAHLTSHPSVQQAMVCVCRSPDGADCLVAYVVPREAAEKPEKSALEQAQLAQWQSVFDDTYSRRTPHSDGRFNTVGWNSAFSRAPYSNTEMQEWVDQSVQRIAALRPRSLWEIGCGTGLLTLRLAPECERYLATDYSDKALLSLRAGLEAFGISLPQGLVLEKRAADDFTGIAPGSFDTIVLNSVVQYFPGVEYLRSVLAGAAFALAPGGKLFIGDVCDLRLLRAFHLALEINRDPASMTISRLRCLVERQVDHEEELYVAPEFFRAISVSLFAGGSVEIRPKCGVCETEMNKYRYDVVLGKGPGPTGTEVQCYQWGQEVADLPSLKRLLDGSLAPALGVCDIPHARLSADAAALALMDESVGTESIADLRAEFLKRQRPGELPVQVEQLAQECGWAVRVECSPISGFHFDAVFEQRVATSSAKPVIVRERPLPATHFANRPVAARRDRELALSFRAALETKLPSYMVPSAFVIVSRFPLTSTGKVDRSGLAEYLDWSAEVEYVAPRDDLEVVLSGIWADVLNRVTVGIRSNFFELGGHSLIATQVMARLQQLFRVDFPLLLLFEAPTVERLAMAMRAFVPQPSRLDTFAKAFLRLHDSSCL